MVNHIWRHVVIVGGISYHMKPVIITFYYLIIRQVTNFGFRWSSRSLDRRLMSTEFSLIVGSLISIWKCRKFHFNLH